MEGNDAKSLTQIANEYGDEKNLPVSLKPDGDQNNATADLISAAPNKGIRPEIREFINQVIVPILVDKYLAQGTARKPESEELDANNGTPVYRDFFTIQQLARRWSCSRATVYNVLRSTGTKVVDFAAKGRRGHKLVPVAAVEEIERRKLSRLS